MSDFLSQDQIDDLLSAGGDDAFGINDVGDDSPAPSAEDSGPDYTALTAAYELFNEQAGTVITTVLNRSIKFSVSQCEAADKGTLESSIPAPVLLITLPMEGQITGTGNVLISTKDVAVLSDLMMMGDGSAEYTEDYKDAIGELFNQIMGAFTTALGEQCGGSVSTGTIEVSEFEFAESSISFDDCDMVIESCNIAEVGESKVGIVLPRELSSQLMGAFKSNVSMDTGGMGDGVGLSASEVDDLTQLSSDMMDSDEGGGGGFQETSLADTGVQAPKENIQMLLDVEMDVSIELGKTDLSIKRILELAPGAIIELDRMAGEPVDLMVNNKVVAKGEVVVVDENFGIRIVSLVSPEERIKSLR